MIPSEIKGFLKKLIGSKLLTLFFYDKRNYLIRSSSLKNLEHVLIWMKCMQQEKRRDREGGERSTLETEEMRRIGSFSLFLCF